LERIRGVTRASPEAVDELDVEEIVVLNLQRAIQTTIDLAAHLISGRGWGLPDSLKAHFQILGERKVIGEELSGRLQAMVGFRNIAIHDYRSIDRTILKGILHDRLVDFEAFGRAVKNFLSL
ncbi:MAG: type VII toxin-antitoxin system HepT family RNase toxin, partial [Candidatus Binatia bacterium]